MKIIISIFLILLCGCGNSYTINQGSETDSTFIYALVDEKENLYLDFETFICSTNCIDILYKQENKHPDAWIILGENSKQVFNTYENKNKIPSIEVKIQDELTALKEYYSQYTWTTLQEENKEADAYYYLENEKTDTDKIFYQRNNPQSICDLEKDMDKYKQDIQRQIENLKQGRSIFPVTIQWKVKEKIH